MALMAQAPLTGVPQRPAAGRAALVLRLWVLPIVAMIACAAGLAVLVPPSLRAADVSTGGPVSVAVLGTLSTEGLPSAAPVSRLTVRNDGPTALSWSSRPSVTGPGGGAFVVDTWLPEADGCTVPGRLLTPSDWSGTALTPGQSTTLCARVRAFGDPQGTAVPTVTVEARPA